MQFEVDEARACPLRKFSHTVYYANFDDCLWVIAVAHQRRRPGYWRSRRFGE